MPTVQLSESVYRAVAERSAAEGFATVDEYVADVLSLGAFDGAEDCKAAELFTPERMAEIAIGEADAAAGRTLSPMQVREGIAKLRADWIARR